MLWREICMERRKIKKLLLLLLLSLCMCGTCRSIISANNLLISYLRQFHQVSPWTFVPRMLYNGSVLELSKTYKLGSLGVATNVITDFVPYWIVQCNSLSISWRIASQLFKIVLATAAKPLTTSVVAFIQRTSTSRGSTILFTYIPRLQSIQTDISSSGRKKA